MATHDTFGTYFLEENTYNAIVIKPWAMYNKPNKKYNLSEFFSVDKLINK